MREGKTTVQNVKTSKFNLFRLACASAICLAIASTANASPTLNYNLAGDWSDTQNPNGPWSYNERPGVPLTHHISNWNGSNQPAWANNAYPNFGHIPFFYKDSSGTVFIHNNDNYNSPSIDANLPSEITWSAPESGDVFISGRVWEYNPALERSEDWSLFVNGLLVSGGVITPSNSSNNPYDLGTGWGGLSSLTCSVEKGDVIAIQFTRHSGTSAGTTMGIDLNIQLTVPEPGAMTILFAFSGLLLLRRNPGK